MRAKSELFRIVQCDMSGHECGLLFASKPVDRSKKVSKLTPYLDDETVMRVGGCLQNICLP